MLKSVSKSDLTNKSKSFISNLTVLPYQGLSMIAVGKIVLKLIIFFKPLKLFLASEANQPV